MRSEVEKDGSSREERRLQLWAARDGARPHPRLEERTLGLTTFAFHPDNKALALGHEDGAVSLLAFPDGREIARAPVFSFGKVSALCFSPDGARLAAGSSKGEVAILSSR